MKLQNLYPRIVMSLIALLFATGVCATGAAAQTGAPIATTTETPEAVAKQMIDAMKQQDWATYARLMHPEALANLKRGYEVMLSSKDAAAARREFFGVATAAEYERLPDAEVFARLMRSFTKIAPGTDEMFKTAEMHVLGGVAESPDLVHVLCRFNMKMADVALTKTEVISFRRDGAAWRALLNADLEATVNAALKTADKMRAGARQ